MIILKEYQIETQLEWEEKKETTNRFIFIIFINVIKGFIQFKMYLYILLLLFPISTYVLLGLTHARATTQPVKLYIYI